MAGIAAEFRVAMRPGKRRPLPETPDGRLQDLIEAAKAPVLAKVEHPFRVIKQQFGFQKTWLRGMTKNHCKVNVIAVLTNLVPGTPSVVGCDMNGEWATKRVQFDLKTPNNEEEFSAEG
jgi:hypothetical protein